MASTPSTLSHPMPTSLSIPTPNSTSPPLSPISNPKPPRVFTICPAFTPDPHAPLIDEFNRLARQFNWSKKDPFRRLMWDWLVREEYQRLVLRVQDGSTGTQLSDWQRLCGELGVGGEWESIRKCKKALAKVHINLVDLLEYRRLGTPLETFPSLSALIRYTRRTGKFVNRGLVKEDPMIKVLLRKMR